MSPHSYRRPNHSVLAFTCSETRMGHTVYFNIETTGQPVLQTLQEELAAFLDFHEKAGPFSPRLTTSDCSRVWYRFVFSVDNIFSLNHVSCCLLSQFCWWWCSKSRRRTDVQHKPKLQKTTFALTLCFYCWQVLFILHFRLSRYPLRSSQCICLWEYLE